MKYLLLLSIVPITLSCQSKKLIVPESSSDRTYLVQGNFTDVSVDRLGRIYLINLNDELIQFDERGQELFRFSISSLGGLSYADVTNPQKILVYYPDYYHIVFLDNTLSEIKRLNLEELGYWDIEAVALSQDNLIWLFDPVSSRLIKIDELGEVFNASNETFSLATNEAQNLKITIDQEKVFLYGSERIWVFDNFGQYLNKIDLKNSGIQIVQNKIITITEEELVSYSLNTEFMDPKTTLGFVKDAVDFYLNAEEGSVMILDNHGLYIKTLSKLSKR